MDRIIKGGLLLLGGAAIGAAAALLLAPKAGEETRKELLDLAHDTKERARKYCEKIGEEWKEMQEAAEAEEVNG